MSFSLYSEASHEYLSCWQKALGVCVSCLAGIPSLGQPQQQYFSLMTYPYATSSVKPSQI